MNKDLTTGKPASVLLRFTLPMLLSVAFQQLYNIADSVIAGNISLPLPAFLRKKEKPQSKEAQ